jgi:hypothetical protein
MTTKWLARTYAFASANSDEEGFPGQLGDLGQSQIVEFNDMEVEPDVTDLDDSMTPVEVTSEPSKGSKNNRKCPNFKIISGLLTMLPFTGISEGFRCWEDCHSSPAHSGKSCR